MSSEFIIKLEKCKKSEEIVSKILINQGMGVEDVSEIKEYYYKGDLIVTKNDKKCFVDVKSDFQISKYGNLFFEIGQDRIYCYTQGWLYKGEYDFIAFDDNCGKIYIIDFKKAQELVKKVAKRQVNKWNDKERAWIEGYLVGLQTAKDNDILISTYKYEIED